MIMKKQFQLIKQKSSVALSLFLVLANQIAAQAGTCSDKTKWLANSLEEPAENNSEQLLIPLKSLSAKTDSSRQTTSIIVNCSDNPTRAVKLRPFVANRPLPSRRDLELALVEQKAKLGQENNARLSGQISTSVSSEENNPASYRTHSLSNDYSQRANTPASGNLAQFNNVNRTYSKPASSKSAQTGFYLMKQAEQHLLSSAKQHLSGSNESATTASSEQLPIPSINGSLANLQTTRIMPTNNAQSEANSAMSMNWTSDESGPSAFSLPAIAPNNRPQVSSSGFGAAGPPPFPLNLLPEASLKQLIKGLAGHRNPNSTTTPSVAFGSWHSPSSLNSVSSNRSGSLPYAGFQSHLTKLYANSDRKANYRRVSALPAVTASHKKSAANQQKTPDATNQKDTSNHNRMIFENQVRVATYPNYTTQSLKLWNFAQ